MTPKTKAAPKYAVATGPITGIVTLPDGRQIDCTDYWVYVESQADADALAHAVAMHYTTHGHPQDPKFQYVNADTKE